MDINKVDPTVFPGYTLLYVVYEVALYVLYVCD